jgi:hypothetical protein
MILLVSHYKFVILLKLGDLKVVVDGDPNTTNLFMDNMLSNMAFLSTSYSFEWECAIWKGLDWECLFINLLNYKVYFQSIICICNREALSHIFTTVTKYQFLLKLQLEFGQYMAVEIKIPLGKETFMNIGLCYFTPTSFSIK